MKNVSILAIHAESFSQTMNLWKTKEMKGLNMHAIWIIIFPKKKKGKSVNMCIKNTNTSPRKKNRKSSKILATDIERGMKMRVLKKLKVLSIFDNTFDFHLQIYMLITYRLLKHCVGQSFRQKSLLKSEFKTSKSFWWEGNQLCEWRHILKILATLKEIHCFPR